MIFQAVCRHCNKKLVPKGIQELKDGSSVLSFEKICDCGQGSIIWVEIKS